MPGAILLANSQQIAAARHDALTLALARNEVTIKISTNAWHFVHTYGQMARIPAFLVGIEQWWRPFSVLPRAPGKKAILRMTTEIR